MSRLLILLPEVREDLSTAFTRYEEISPGRGGARFSSAFDAVLTQIEDGFVTHRQVFAGFHRVILKRYPYTVYYRLRDRNAVIVALLYARFSPATIEKTLRERTFPKRP